MKILIATLLLLALPATATSAGPLDGAWYDDRGNAIVINSQVVHATVHMRSPSGQSHVVRARYTGYTRLSFQTSYGSWGSITMVGGDRIRVTGGGWDGTYYR
jgi:hypothetical protein